VAPRVANKTKISTGKKLSLTGVGSISRLEFLFRRLHMEHVILHMHFSTGMSYKPTRIYHKNRVGYSETRSSVQGLNSP